jgi:long-chain acyl-CoA synthetase
MPEALARKLEEVIGLPFVEGYGLSETMAPTHINPPQRPKRQCAGIPFFNTDSRVLDLQDSHELEPNEVGEIVVHGPQVFRGYWNAPEATAAALDEDGWFHTGDVGEIDSEGFVTITGRKKEIIVTAGGKNVVPAVLEDRVRAHFLVSQAVVVGEGKPFVGALITLDTEAVGPWLEQQGRPADTSLAELADDPEVIASVQSAVDEANAHVSRAESIRKFRILAIDWTEEGGQVTPTMKLKRNVVMREHRDDVEALYQ